MSSATATAPEKTNGAQERHTPREQAQSNVPALAGPRLPYHPAIEERFGVDKASWKALVEAVFPNATSTESIILALSYCRARKLDPFKRNVHIVPIWNKEAGGYVDTIWPGIGELRTTAFRTGDYAGSDDAKFGPDITRTFTGSLGRGERARSIEETVTFPEWAQITVYRMVKGERREFAGPKVYWLETYATRGHDNDVPNDMWANRPRGQLEKCAEAAALRKAFPEECGGDYIPEEVQHIKPAINVESTQVNSLDQLTDKLAGTKPGEQAEELAPRPMRDPTGAHQDLPPDHGKVQSEPEQPPTNDEPLAALKSKLATLTSPTEITDAVFAFCEQHTELAAKAQGIGRERKAAIRGGKQGQQGSLV